MNENELIGLAMNIVGQQIMHDRFGDGEIIGFDPASKKMTFQYDEEMKSVDFPQYVKDKIKFYDKESARLFAEAFDRSIDDYWIHDRDDAEESSEVSELPVAEPQMKPIPENHHLYTVSEALTAYNKVQSQKRVKDKERESSADKARKAFVRDFPLSRLHSLKLSEYLYAAEGLGYDESFCTRFKNELNEYGSLGNVRGDMFGVYIDGRKKVALNKSLAKIYGGDINSAYDGTKDAIVDLLENAEKGLFDNPDQLIEYSKSSILYSNFLLKLLAVYYPDDYLPAYGDDRLDEYCTAMGIPTSNLNSSVEKAIALLEWKRNTPEVSTRKNSSFMWFVNYCADSHTTISSRKNNDSQNTNDTSLPENSSFEESNGKKAVSIMKSYSGTIPDMAKEIDSFVDYVRFQDGDAFERIDFHNESKFLDNEAYKERIARAARQELSFEDWKEEDIGTGKIAEKVVAAIEVADNLVERAHVVPIFKDQLDASSIDFKPDCEQVLFDIYCGSNEERAFQAATKLFGAKYPLIAYLFFIKDDTRFLPVSPDKFDKLFQMMGIAFKVSYKCSWENYGEFISIIRHVQKQLENADISDDEITLLDAHSFVWIMQYESYKDWISEGKTRIAEAEKIEEEVDTLGVEGLTRKALVNQRINQSAFRKLLLRRYGSCCLCGVQNPELLTASHIKPWAESTPDERTDVNNGFLLCPNHDKLFDAGYISFDDDGTIILSETLSKNDEELLHVSSDMIIKLTEKNRRYLEYHRVNILKK